jgi:SAM-dependent methyltransferase
LTGRNLTVKEFYQRVWQEYADPRSHPITAQALNIQRRLLESWARERRPRSILDLGCGPSPVVSPGAADRVVYADLVLPMLLRIRQTLGRAAVCLDACGLPFRDRSFDLVWCGLLVDHLPNVEEGLGELFRVLAPGGTLGLASWDRSLLPGERYPEDARMRFTTERGEDLTVASYPNWPQALAILKSRDPEMTLESFPVVAGSYVLQVAASQAATAATPTGRGPSAP